MSTMIHLIYNSAATHAFTDAELESLLQKARNNNAARDITGMLLYLDGCFFQVLEGPQDKVDALVETIRQDQGHARMSVIIREPIAHRAFSEWTMGFTRLSLDDARSIDGLNDFFGSGHVLTELDAGRAKKILTAFKQGRWRLRLVAASSQPPAKAGQELAVSHRATITRPPFTFAFQPIIDVVKRQLVGYEALVRGPQQEHAAEVLQRVPLAEIAAFDEDARRMAIGLAARLGLATNLHLNAVLPGRADAAETIDSTLETAARCGISADRLVLEIKHEATVADPSALASRLRECRRKGLRISIDDFGSGHAGLALLEHYQPDMISLSMWLVRDIETHGPRQAILRGLVQTCRDLGIDIIAKGVETTEEYSWLHDEGIERFQGFLFARPGFESLPKPMLPTTLD